MNNFHAEYTKYINSYEWRKRAAKFKKEIRYCDRCGAALPIGTAQVHHKHYQTLGKETRDDIEVLCKRCHKKEDRKRAIRGVRRSETALYDAQLDGWATKVYGEDWELFTDCEQVAEEFNQWLENRKEEYYG